MVDSTLPATNATTASDLQHTDCLAFFDDVFLGIPAPYRRIEKEDKSAAEQAVKPKGKDKAMSILDIHQNAKSKIDEMQRVNREKSLAKIKDLTV